MKIHRYRVYCGPTLVKAYAARLRSHGLDVYLEGTSHVYVESRVDRETFVMLLQSQFSGVRGGDVYECGRGAF